MQTDTIAAVRFGYGLGPNLRYGITVSDLISEAEDFSQKGLRIPFVLRQDVISNFQHARRAGDLLQKKKYQTEINCLFDDDIKHFAGVAVVGIGFGARLTAFWADHFSCAANGPLLRCLIPDLIERAIRPHITKPFSSMLKAVVFHPALLNYLTQQQSVGPNSPHGVDYKQGLNENLARELLELHTLGVTGAYSQSDVRALAEILSGLTVRACETIFDPNRAEPGSRQFLGEDYDGREAGRASIEMALDRLAIHRDTSTHIARKLIVHFLGEPVEEDFVHVVSSAFMRSGGNLATTIEALLNDDRAWVTPFRKSKLPFDFVISALKASGETPTSIDQLSRPEIRQNIRIPMELMGQDPFKPPGPDGWKANPSEWITPQGMAARINWAFEFIKSSRDNVSAEDFLNIALRDQATPELFAAIKRASSNQSAKALVLSSPDFNCR